MCRSPVTFSPRSLAFAMFLVVAALPATHRTLRAESAPGDRSDGVPEKLRLLQDAYDSGNYDLAMSLAASIKDTLSLERLTKGRRDGPRIGASHTIAVGKLPEAWSTWATGWSVCLPVKLTETAGIARIAEPVDLSIGFREGDAAHPAREIRVVRIDAENGSLHEVPSQVYDERRREGERHCQVVFLADVMARGESHYLIFSGNADAELPAYSTDLKALGEGFGLDIENEHFVAQLSRQMGQLERLVIKRQHGLELFAGGKGHGEPPCIDWAHDYVDVGNFQKLRVRNWAACPNYEVVKGPLCVRVRRWGFPHSPVHPLFTPSRMHIDQTYTFYAGLPYFFKEGRFDMIKDFAIEAMRDDEWVFSGYSFTETLWMDREGNVHEGQVAGQHAADLWGVGFYHHTSRDAFMALWLEHEAEQFDGIQHGGPPTLQYDGHGQLWSRYPANQAEFRAGASIRQRNAYVVSPYLEEAGAAGLETLRRQLLSPLEVRPGLSPHRAAAAGTGSLAREGETRRTAPLKRAIWDALQGVRDEQFYAVDANIVDMGYVYDVRVRDGVANILVTMPHRGRPVFEFLVTQGGGRVDEGIQERLLKIDGVRKVVVDFTWDPPWTVARLTPAGRRAMGLAAP